MTEKKIDNQFRFEWSSENDPGIEWTAVAWASLVSAIVFLIAGSIATAITQVTLLDSGGVVESSPWTFVKMIASIVMGPTTLFSPLSAVSLIMGIVLNFIIAIISTILLVLAIHRWGLLMGLIGGALFGLALFAVNFYFFAPLWFPWFAGLVSTSMALAHMTFGAAAGVVYELLDED